MSSILEAFKLSDEQETYEQITETITKGVVFNGANLWVLVFAIFVASVGLNVNSTAVIIGAMLISPLMGPIMGFGLGLGTYNLKLVQKSFKNLSFAVIVSLFASTCYFLISPLNEAHSELFARTTPNIYDVLIAFFGGLAGIVAITSKQKGNALQGAAIATALMPPLCTAGFGIATQQWDFFFGAFYLFIINSVFISLATYVTVRLLKFPSVLASNPKYQLLIKRVVALVVLLTLIPSIILGYKLTQKERFFQNASQFIENELILDKSFVLEHFVEYPEKSIRLIIGGEEVEESKINELQSKLKIYDLEGVSLDIENKLSFETKIEQVSKEGNDRISYLNNELSFRQHEVNLLKKRLDSISIEKETFKQISKEIKVQNPTFSYVELFHSLSDSNIVVSIKCQKNISKNDIEKLHNWLQVRLDSANINLFLDVK
jgi:uncharacterized hydrophobic protein (TIGR00271 family)